MEDEEPAFVVFYGEYEKKMLERKEIFVKFTKTDDAIHTILITTIA